MKTLRIFLLGLIMASGLFGCTRYGIEAPEGFAEVQRQGAGRFLAVSPEGVRLSIKTEKNYPKQDLTYWQTAMEEHMRQAGYKLIAGPESFTAKKRQGAYFEWGAPYEGKDYLYLTGLVVAGRKLLVIEAGGEAGVFLNYRENIVQSLSRMTTP